MMHHTIEETREQIVQEAKVWYRAESDNIMKLTILVARLLNLEEDADAGRNSVDDST